MVLSSATSSPRPTCSTSQGGVVDGPRGGGVVGAVRLGGSTSSSLGVVGVGLLPGLQVRRWV